MPWAGWGAGPAGAGAAGGPSRWFLGAALVACAVVTVILALRGRWFPASAGLVITAYFFARVFLGLGRPRA
ncbi:MAG TPA: hypothetical protein VEB43_10405 [Anaeromyxobacter sp.]|nr:hypothetical protein [Anaeromyxobacter sp.]